MKTVRGITLLALALVIAGCQDDPMFPESEASEAEQAAALDQAALQVQATLDEQLARGPVDTAIARRDGRRTRPDSSSTRPTRPDQQRPDETDPACPERRA